MSITDFPLIWDVSEHQGELDWDIALEHGVVGAYIRAGVGIRKDPLFQRNWEEAGRIGIFRTSYWAPWPELDWDTALNRWFVQHPVIENVERVIDFEHIAGESAACFEYMFGAVSEHDGVDPLTYSRLNLLEPYLLPYVDKSKLKLILAEYNLYRDKEEDGLVLPDGIEIDQVLMKQTADKIVIDGIGAVDHNRFIGPPEVMESWLGIGDLTNPVGECGEIQEDIAQLALGASVLSQKLKTLEQGQLEITEDVMNLEAEAIFWDLNIDQHNELVGVVNDMDRVVQANAVDIEELRLSIEKLEAKRQELLQKLVVQDDQLENLEAEVNDCVDAGAFNAVIASLNARIDGLQGGHDHPKWMRRLGLVR